MGSYRGVQTHKTVLKSILFAIKNRSNIINIVKSGLLLKMIKDRPHNMD